MYLTLLDPREGVTASRQWAAHAAGDSAERAHVDGVIDAIAALDRVPAQSGRPNIHLFLTEAGAIHPGGKSRARIAEATSRIRNETYFGLVTTSTLARTVLSVIQLTRPGNPLEHVRAFPTTGAAFAWFESVRPGAGALLTPMLARLEQTFRTANARTHRSLSSTL